MKVYLASDHAGFELKNKIITFVHDELGADEVDVGPFAFNQADDYPDFIWPLARKVAGDKGSFGIIFGGSGQGEAICANRVFGIRATVYYGPAAHEQTDAAGEQLSILSSMRVHGDANVLSLGARFITEQEAKDAVRLFLTTPFTGDERHRRRIAKLDHG